MTCIIDLDEFMKELKEKFSGRFKDGLYKIPTAEFGEFCKDLKLKPTPVRRYLAKKDLIETGMDKGKINYTMTARLSWRLRSRWIRRRATWTNISIFSDSIRSMALERAYRDRGQKIAHKISPKRNSPIIYDIEELEV